jgi:hypothetical protein
VGLEADTIDAETCALHELDNVQGGLGLVAILLEVKVIVIQLRSWVGRGGCLERYGNVVGPEDLEEDRVPKRSIVIKSFVDRIPTIARALVVADDVGDVSLNGSSEGVSSPLGVCDWPPWLAMVPQSLRAQASEAIRTKFGKLLEPGQGVAAEAL